MAKFQIFIYLCMSIFWNGRMNEFESGMKTWKLELHEEMLLALLRAALHQQEVETACFQQATAENWLQCYLLVVRQGVAALAWEGVEQLPVELCPPLDVKLSWALVEKKQVAKYRKHCQALDELTRLYATDEAISDGINFHDLEDFSLVYQVSSV